LHVLDLPARLRVPVEGGAAVKVDGTAVAKGEALTVADVEAGPAVLAPTSGRIVGLGRAVLLDGREVTAVDLEPDFEDRPAAGEQHVHLGHEHDRAGAGAPPVAEVAERDLPEWIAVLRRGGVSAERRASPDLLGQLMMALRRPIDTVVCDLCDADPPLRLNAVLAHSLAPMLVAGVKLLGRLVGARRFIVLVEGGAPGRWWTPLERAARDAELALTAMPHRYPQTDPTLLLYNLLGRKLRPGRLPAEQGVLVLDAAAAIAVGRRASREQPMLRAPVAILDHRTKRAAYVVAPLGTPVRQVLAGANVPAAERATLRAGDLLRAIEVSADAVVSASELTLHVLEPAAAVMPDPCIRCGWCAESCPTRVQPAGVLEAAQRGSAALADQYGVDACIECGVCAHVCPSRLPLLTGIRVMRRLMEEEGGKRG